ncbi:hypothetical protein SAMD00019534_095280, partial [Acytostelium subglobosum LB1]|uniref:hypothetical protein n=1 Tax=Acytostelium subglobosum LB1 TaxID=1410327 RepID=UPI000644EF2A
VCLCISLSNASLLSNPLLRCTLSVFLYPPPLPLPFHHLSHSLIPSPSISTTTTTTTTTSAAAAAAAATTNISINNISSSNIINYNNLSYKYIYLYSHYSSFNIQFISLRNSLAIPGMADEELDHRKRKVGDAEIYTHPVSLEGDDLLVLKYSPMIYAETPSPKCRTPRTNSSQTTSPSIISGSSPMLSASSGAYFSLSNFSNNLSLNNNTTTNNHVPHHHHLSSPMHHSQVDIDQHHHSPRSQSTSPIVPLSFGSACNNEKVHSPAPIPSVPFNWRGATSSVGHPPNKGINHLSTGTSPLISINGDSKTLPNPFSSLSTGQSSPKFSTPSPNFFAHGSNLKVPTEMLHQQGTSVGSINSISPSALDKPFPTSPTNSSINTSNINTSTTTTTSTPNTNPNLSKLQQQNLILNCTY